MTSEVQTELSVRVVLPHAEFKTLLALVDFGCQAVALANPNDFREQIPRRYESLQRRRLLQANNETPMPGGGTSESRTLVFSNFLRTSHALQTLCPDLQGRQC